MKIKMMNNFSLLSSLYKINSCSGHEDKIIKFILNYLKKNFKDLEIDRDDIGNIYVTKGKSEEFPCVVSHVDQVQNFDGELYVMEENGIVTAYDRDGKQQGLGADDKNGIYICLELLKAEPILKCVFFVQEEIGCIGSLNCNMNFFKDCKYVLQCDRKGNSDIIYETYYTELCKYDFISENLLQKYGYSPNIGLMTDVETLKDLGLGVSCCNISCGYYNPHTKYEYTNLYDLEKCLNFVKEIIKITKKTIHINESDIKYGRVDPELSFFGRYYSWDLYS